MGGKPVSNSLQVLGKEAKSMPTAILDHDKPSHRSVHSVWSRAIARLRDSGLLIASSSLLFAILQSVCTFFAALDGLRTVIGIGSLVLADSAGKWIDSFHADWLRVPMIWIAVLGSLLNLLVLWQIRRLRANPAAAWRQKPVRPQKLRIERLQAAMAILTLLLVAIEERQHLLWARHL
jgi:hypothetical protein